MNLMKWFRKNNKRIMAVVVVILMIGFVGDAYIRQLGYARMGRGKVIATYHGNKKITVDDLRAARQELEILQGFGGFGFGAGDILRSIPAPGFNVPDLKGFFMGELLFANPQVSPVMISRVEDLIRRNNYSISGKQLSEIYSKSADRVICWILLKKEAEEAGIYVSNENVAEQLRRLIPQMSTGATYSKLVGSIINRHSVSEDKFLSMFGKLMAVLQYSSMRCSSEDVTNQQLRLAASLNSETMDVNFVKIEVELFSKSQAEPSAGKLAEQFEKYKSQFAGNPTQENPYGFGYKLSEAVKLEYIAVRLEDIKTIVPAPTEEECRDFYQKNKERPPIAEEVLADINDPNKAA